MFPIEMASSKMQNTSKTRKKEKSEQDKMIVIQMKKKQRVGDRQYGVCFLKSLHNIGDKHRKTNGRIYTMRYEYGNDVFLSSLLHVWFCCTCVIFEETLWFMKRK